MPNDIPRLRIAGHFTLEVDVLPLRDGFLAERGCESQGHSGGDCMETQKLLIISIRVMDIVIHDVVCNAYIGDASYLIFAAYPILNGLSYV